MQSISALCKRYSNVFTLHKKKYKDRILQKINTLKVPDF